MRFSNTRRGCAVEVAAAVPAAERDECLALRAVVDAGCDRGDSERGRQSDRRATHLLCNPVTAQWSHPGPVELQPPDRRAREPVERRQPATDFIDDDLDAALDERVEHGRITGDECPLGDAQLELLRWHA